MIGSICFIVYAVDILNYAKDDYKCRFISTMCFWVVNLGLPCKNVWKCFAADLKFIRISSSISCRPFCFSFDLELWLYAAINPIVVYCLRLYSGTKFDRNFEKRNELQEMDRKNKCNQIWNMEYGIWNVGVSHAIWKPCPFKNTCIHVTL
jgi:hypothetical protein